MRFYRHEFVRAVARPAAKAARGRPPAARASPTASRRSTSSIALHEDREQHHGQHDCAFGEGTAMAAMGFIKKFSARSARAHPNEGQAIERAPRVEFPT